MKRVLLVVAAALVVVATMAQTVPPGGVVTQGLAKTSDLMVLEPLGYWVSGSGDDRNACTQSYPCRTYQRVCDLVPRDVCDAVTLTALADYTGTGCRKEGLRRCCRPGADGGVVCGSFTVTGTRKLYVRSDGGTIAATLAAVTNGSATTGQAEEWSVVGGDFAPGELAGKWASVASGTGSGLDQLWPILANDAGVITLNAHGEVKTHPAVGSVVAIYEAPGSLINAALGQPWANAGPPSEAQVNKQAAFIFSTGAAAASGAYNDRWITVQDMTTNISVAGSALVASSGPGPVEIRHVASTNAAALYRCVAGVVQPTLERNIITSTSGVLMLAYNSALGCDVVNGQFFNNYAPISTSGFFISAGSARNLYSQSNFAPSALIRTGTCDTCRSRIDTLAGVRMTGDFIDGTGGRGCWSVDGDTLTGNSGGAYTINLTGGCVVVDSVGPTSTIFNPPLGHVAALAFGGSLQWAPTTVFDAGTGDNAVVFTSTPSLGVTVMDIAARSPKRWVNWDQSWAGQADSAAGRANLIGRTHLVSMYPHAINTVHNHGGVCVRQAFEVTDVVMGIGGPAAGAGTNNQIRLMLADGGSQCTATFPCSSMTTVDSPVIQTVSGSCAYPAGTCLKVNEVSAGCTPDPVVDNISIYGWNQ